MSEVGVGSCRTRPQHGISAGRQFDFLPEITEVLQRGSPATELLQTSGHLGRSSFSGDYRLGAAPCGDFRPILARDLRGMQKKPAVDMSKTYNDLQDFYGSDGTRTRDLRSDRCDETVSADFIQPPNRRDQTVFGRFRETPVFA
jgi:hypothetical protein